MSNEPVKLEVDCAVAPYSHHHHNHHHHHHLHHHHNIPQIISHHHHHHHHTSDADISPPHSSSDEVTNEEEEEEDDDDDEDDDEEEEEEEQDDDEDGEEDDGDEDDDDCEEDDDDEEEDFDEDDDDDDIVDDCDDIVDPVGTQPSQNDRSITVTATTASTTTTETATASTTTTTTTTTITNGLDCNHGTNITSYEHSYNINEHEGVDSELGHLTQLHDANTTPDLLDSERMLEVTRKLFRSTERDPDRDLRKQVLLRTAIKKLPHFMEYNHYSDSFDQSFQLHNNTIDSNSIVSINSMQQPTTNTPVNCFSPTQYYEHHHMNHSVQPNAIQMSTTSLRMLDLNDDSELDSLEIKHNHYENIDLEHHIYSHHYTSLEGQTNSTHEYNYNGEIHIAPDDSVNSTPSPSNDSAGDLTGISILETSLNETNDYQNNSHDSDVALFSTKSNKRSSSSFGLDGEMEIDHLTDLTSSNQFNSGGSISNLNHCKKLRKREIIE